MRRGNGSVGYRCTAFFDRVVSIGGASPDVECYQGRLPALAQTVETAMWECPV